MKKRNIAKFIWITAIFLELIVILIMIIDYKIHYQYLIKNKLYFYECTGALCVTEVEDNDHLLYSTYDCNYETCPTYKKELDDTYALLEENSNNLLYNYRTGEIISKEYDDYQFINNQNVIVTRNNKKGIINLENKLLVETIYDELGYDQNGYLSGYNLNLIIAKKNDNYGIISYKTGEVIEPITETSENIDKLLAIINEKEN